MSTIRLLEKYHAMATAAAVRGSNRSRSTHSQSAAVLGSKTPAADFDEIPHSRRQSSTPQHRLSPIDKRYRNRATKKRRSRRPEATEVTPQHGGGVASGGPKFRVNSGGRRGRLKPLISRRTRLEMAELAGAPAVPPAAKPDVKQPADSRRIDSQPQILERGSTFTSSTIVSEVSIEGCSSPSTFQLHHLPLNLTASTSGSDLESSIPSLKSSETRMPHWTDH